MKTAVPAAGALLAAAVLLTGCGSSNGTPNVNVSVGSSGASAGVNGNGASADLAGPCKDLRQTIASIPSKLQQAATSKQPAQNVANAISDIGKQLKSDVNSGSGELKTAVDDYVGKLQQVASTVKSGHMPDLSKLQSTEIDNACTNSSATPTPSASSSS